MHCKAFWFQAWCHTTAPQDKAKRMPHQKHLINSNFEPLIMYLHSPCPFLLLDHSPTRVFFLPLNLSVSLDLSLSLKLSETYILVSATFDISPVCSFVFHSWLGRIV